MYPMAGRRAIVSLATCLAAISGQSLAAAEGDGDVESSGVLQEVLVTAQKREQRLQDVPIPVSALDANTLVAGDRLRLQDYYASVPGLGLTSQGNGGASLSIRGVTTGAKSNPTVGVTVDDVPVGSTIALGTSTFAPDIDPSDLARIEVLRGPQGTLYGASSIGGLLRYVTLDPSMNGVSGRVEGGLDSTHNGNATGYGLRGAVNVPLGDMIAVRISGFTRRDPGYIDDPVLHLNGVNQADVSGGHFAALWRPAPGLALKLSALIQDASADGTSDSTPQAGLGDLQQSRAFTGAGAYRHKLNLYTATLDADLGSMKLVSISGYGLDKYDAVVDQTSIFGSISSLLYGVSAAEQLKHNATEKFTQEIRLSGSLGRWLDWLFGGFYTHENTPTHDIYAALDPAGVARGGPILDDPYPTAYAEYSAFTDLTFHLSERIDVQLGGRESHNDQTYTETLAGPAAPLFFGLPSPIINPLVRTRDNSFTYLVTPSFKVSADLMMYARLASGYRPGGPNPTCSLFGYPCHYNPDTTRNYEVGVKGEVLDKVLSFDASIYYIDWKNVQLQVNQPTTGAVYYSNGSRAKSQGVELTVQSRPATGLTIAGWIALNQAVLTADLPADSAAVGLAGDRLPYSSRFSGNLSIDREFPVAGSIKGFIGGVVSYVGSRESEFSSSETTPRITLPGYTQANLRAGVRRETWTANLFVNNIADRRGALSYVTADPTGITYIQPRTLGLTLSKTF